MAKNPYCYNKYCKHNQVECRGKEPFFITEPITNGGKRMIIREYFLNHQGKDIFLCGDCAGVVTGVTGIRPSIPPLSKMWEVEGRLNGVIDTKL